MAQNDLLIRISGDTKGFAQAMASVNAQLVATDKAAVKTGSTFTSLGNSMSGFSAAMAGALSVGALTQFAQSAIQARAQMDSLERGLTAVMGSSSAAAVELGKLKEVAKLPGLGFTEAARGSINLQAAGFNADLARKALMGFGNALATVGKGKADLDGVITALTQISAKGKVSAEEINQLAERLPQIRQLMRSAFGTADTEALQKMGISSQMFIEKIIAELEKLPKATGGIQNELENFRDEWNQIMSELGATIAPVALKITSGFLESVKGIRDAMALIYLELDKARDYASRWLKDAGPFWQQVAATVALINNPFQLGKASAGSGATPPKAPPAPTAATDDGPIRRNVEALKAQTKAANESAAALTKVYGAMQGPITLGDALNAEMAKLEQADYDAYFKDLAKGMKEIAEGAKTATIETARYNRVLAMMRPDLVPTGLTTEQLDSIAVEQNARRAKEGLKDLGIQYGAVLKDAKESWKGQSEVMREVSTVFTDMSRDIAKVILEGGKLKDVFTNAMKSMAEAMIRLVIQGAFKQLGTVIAKTVGDLSGLGKIFSGIFGGATSGAASGAVGSVAGSAVGSAAGGAASGAVGSAVGAGITGIVGAVAGVVGAVSSVIGNFQMAGMNKSLDLIEHETRFSQIHLSNILEKINRHLPGIDDLNKRLNEAAVNGWKVWTEGAMQGAIAGGGGGYNTTINFSGAWIGYRDVDTFVDDLVRRIKSKL